MNETDFARLERLRSNASVPRPQATWSADVSAWCEAQDEYHRELHRLAPDLVTLARRGLRAEREVCGTCAERQLHGSVQWCPVKAGRSRDDGFCDDWRPQPKGGE